METGPTSKQKAPTSKHHKHPKRSQKGPTPTDHLPSFAAMVGCTRCGEGADHLRCTKGQCPKHPQYTGNVGSKRKAPSSQRKAPSSNLANGNGSIGDEVGVDEGGAVVERQPRDTAQDVFLEGLGDVDEQDSSDGQWLWDQKELHPLQRIIARQVRGNPDITSHVNNVQLANGRLTRVPEFVSPATTDARLALRDAAVARLSDVIDDMFLGNFAWDEPIVLRVLSVTREPRTQTNASMHGPQYVVRVVFGDANLRAFKTQLTVELCERYGAITKGSVIEVTGCVPMFFHVASMANDSSDAAPVVTAPVEGESLTHSFTLNPLDTNLLYLCALTLYAYIYTFSSTYIYMHKHFHIHTHTYTYIFTDTYVYIHNYIHIYIHIHTRSPTHSPDIVYL